MRSIIYILAALFFLFKCSLGYGLESNNHYSLYGGIIYPKNYKTGFHFGAALNLGEFSESTNFITNLTYMAAKKKDSRLDFSNMVLSAELHSVPKQKSINFYYGAGVGINLLTWKKTETYTDTTRTQEYILEMFENRIGFYPLLGFIKNFNGLAVFIEFKYHLISEFNNFQISLGVNFGKRKM